MDDFYSKLDLEAGIAPKEVEDYSQFDREANIPQREIIHNETRQFGLETETALKRIKPLWKPGTVGSMPVGGPDLTNPANLQDPIIFAKALCHTSSKEEQRKLADIRNDYFVQDQAVKAYEKEEQRITTVERARSGFFPAISKSARRSSANVVSGIAGVMSDYITKDFLPEASQAREYYREIAGQARLTPSEEGTAAYLGDLIGEALPYMVASMAVATAGGAAVPGIVIAGISSATAGRFLGGAFVGYAVEGENAYQDALQSGATEQEARLEKNIVGSINALIEASQVSSFFKFYGATGRTSLKALINAIKKRAYKKILAEGGKFSYKLLALSFKEGIEEWMQENVSQAAPALLRGVYPKKADGSPDYWAMFKRSAKAFLGGAIVGGIFGAGGTIAIRKNLVENLNIPENQAEKIIDNAKEKTNKDK